jgi:hypothetical protein
VELLESCKPGAFKFSQCLNRSGHADAYNKNWGVSMILRAIFWIGLVFFLMPHEPDLGFGRPGGQANQPTRDAIGGLIQSPNAECRQDCSAGFLAGVRALAIRNLEQVRADLAANGHPWRRHV